MSLQPLNNMPSLSDRAYSVIKDAILSLKIQPGSTVAIGQLAQQLGVSRTPVRDALLQLEKEGLVTVLPQKGARISAIAIDDVREIFELRILFESYAAKVAASRLTGDDLAHLDGILRDAEATFAQGDQARAAAIDRQLHELLVQKVDNQRLTAYLSALDTHYTRIRLIAASLAGRWERSHAEHGRLVAVLKTGDGDAAAKSMEEHLISVREDILILAATWAHSMGNGDSSDLT